MNIKEQVLSLSQLLELYKLSAEEMYKKLFEIKKCTYCENKAIFYSLLKPPELKPPEKSNFVHSHF